MKAKNVLIVVLLLVLVVVALDAYTELDLFGPKANAPAVMATSPELDVNALLQGAYEAGQTAGQMAAGQMANSVSNGQEPAASSLETVPEAAAETYDPEFLLSCWTAKQEGRRVSPKCPGNEAELLGVGR